MVSKTVRILFYKVTDGFLIFKMSKCEIQRFVCILFANRFVYFYICRVMRGDIISAFKGIHPGKIIEREIRKQKITQRGLAEKIGEHSQTLNAVIKGHRALTVEMAVKIEDTFGYEEGMLLTLQAYYDIAQYKIKKAQESVKGVPNISRILFWDADFDKIDWGRYRKSIIARVLERGSKEDIAEIARFYGLTIDDLEQFKSKNQYRMRTDRNEN